MTSAPYDDDDFRVVTQAKTHAAGSRIYGPFCRVGEAFQVYIARDALQRALRLAEAGYTETRSEVAGALIGTVQHDTVADITFVEITEIVPVASSSQNRDVVIEPAEWSRAEAITNEPQFRGRSVVVGWYHSHPNIGIFLSPIDHETQARRFGRAWQVALVLDPVRVEIGAFHGAEGRPCPLYLIPAPREQALIPAAVALAHPEQLTGRVVVPPWRSPLVLGFIAVLLLGLVGMVGLLIASRDQQQQAQGTVTAVAETTATAAVEAATRIAAEAQQTATAVAQTATAVAMAVEAARTADDATALVQLHTTQTAITESYNAVATANATAAAGAEIGAKNELTRVAAQATARAEAALASLRATQIAHELEITATAEARQARSNEQTAIAQATLAGRTRTPGTQATAPATNTQPALPTLLPTAVPPTAAATPEQELPPTVTAPPAPPTKPPHTPTSVPPEPPPSPTSVPPTEPPATVTLAPVDTPTADPGPETPTPCPLCTATPTPIDILINLRTPTPTEMPIPRAGSAADQRPPALSRGAPATSGTDTSTRMLPSPPTAQCISLAVSGPRAPPYRDAGCSNRPPGPAFKGRVFTNPATPHYRAPVAQENNLR